MPDDALDLTARLQRRLSAGGPDLRRRAEALMQGARERWEQAQATQAAMRSIRETVVSPRREVSVTAEWGGAVTEIVLLTGAYKRMPAKELAALLQSTIAEAQRKVRSSAADVLAPSLPEGMDAAGLLAGDLDLGAMPPSGRSPYAEQLLRSVAGTAGSHEGDR